MPDSKDTRKGVVLLIVLATILVVAVLAGVILGIITNQYRLSHHNTSRIRAYYAAKGIMNYAQDMLRKGTWVIGVDKTYYAYFQNKGCIDDACDGLCKGSANRVECPYIPDDADIPYKVQVDIYPLNHAPDSSSLSGKVTQLKIKVDYTYTP
ncbi:MAG: hypothetical protein PHY88_03295 [Candidatus Omnitrophica bacterium]|nr:hypothetical protein [Candidatus Omnitrophota bacterium]